MIIQKTKEYIPYCFNQRGFKTRKYFQINSNTKRRYVHDLKDKFNFEEILSVDGSLITNNSTAEYYVGNGIIRNSLDAMGLIVCYNRNNLELPMALIDKSNLSSGDYRRIITAINKFGWSSRKQVINMRNLNDIFGVDLLKSTMEDYDKEKQLNLSKEFIEYARPTEEVSIS